ncbi:MAG: hypothetical protein ACYC35_19710 [Pirellulales bacterium]
METIGFTEAVRNKLLVNEREAGRLCSVCPKTIWNYTYPRGTLRSVRIGSRVLYSVQTLQEWIKAQEAAGAAAESEVSHEA